MQDDYDFDDEYVGDAADEFLRQAAAAGRSFDEDEEDDLFDDTQDAADEGGSETLGLEALGPETLGLEALEADLGAGPDPQLAWRETYHVLFSRDTRPTLTQVEAALGNAAPRLRFERWRADDDGLFESVVVHAPEDNAALEITFESGDAVTEQSTALAKSLRKELEPEQVKRLLRADARLDVLHFERLGVSGLAFRFVDGDLAGADDLLDEEAWADEALAEGLDPASLITVVEALAELTEGLAVDPAAGAVL